MAAYGTHSWPCFCRGFDDQVVFIFMLFGEVQRRKAGDLVHAAVGVGAGFMHLGASVGHSTLEIQNHATNPSAGDHEQGVDELTEGPVHEALGYSTCCRSVLRHPQCEAVSTLERGIWDAG